MDKEIEDLYGGSDFLSIYFSTKSLPLVSYQINGLGSSDEHEYADQWKLTGGVEGTFDYSIFGIVSSPGAWSDYTAELAVNSLGSGFRAEHETKGFLGDGFCQDKKVLFRLYVNPQIARDILDKFFYFDKLEGNEEYSIRCDVVNLRHSSNSLEDEIWYEIVRLYC